MQKTDIETYLDAVEIKPKSVYVVHERLERKLPLHSHSKSQLTYVDGGIAYIFTGEHTYFIPARHYIWIPKDLPHYVKVRTSATITRNLYFYTEDDHTDPFYTKFGIYPVNNLLFEMIGFTNNWSGYIEKKDPGYHFVAAIKNMLPQMSTESFPIALPTTTNTKLRPIILYMAQNFGQPITLENIAARFSMGERTLSRLFQSTINISFLQYLKLLRIVRAIEMILQDNLSTTEIAYQTGYNSLAAFSKAFFQVTNIRPSDFNRQNR
jgi:AraC-like DNA-binding protein